MHVCFSASGKSCIFAARVCHEHVNYFQFFLVVLFNDSRKSKDNQLQAGVCRLPQNVMFNLSNVL